MDSKSQNEVLTIKYALELNQIHFGAKSHNSQANLNKNNGQRLKLIDHS